MIPPCCEQGDLPTLEVWEKAPDKSPERDGGGGASHLICGGEGQPPARVIEECGNEEGDSSGAGGRLSHSFLPDGKQKGATWSSPWAPAEVHWRRFSQSQTSL